MATTSRAGLCWREVMLVVVVVLVVLVEEEGDVKVWIFFPVRIFHKVSLPALSPISTCHYHGRSSSSSSSNGGGSSIVVVAVVVVVVMVVGGGARRVSKV